MLLIISSNSGGSVYVHEKKSQSERSGKKREKSRKVINYGTLISTSELGTSTPLIHI
mgnify:CR=1 FL=1